MIHIKKTILTLALLIAATTQAWATDYLYIDISSDGKSATICYGDPEGKPYLDPNYTWTTNGRDNWDIERHEIRRLITTVTFDESCQTFNGKSLKALFNYFIHLTTINGINNLCTDDVDDMNGMFADCQDLANLDLSSFNTAKVKNMQYMFNNCENLTTVDLSSFNTANVENMQYMFCHCSKLETIYVSDDWSTAKVTSSSNMFRDSEKLPGYASATVFDARMAKLTTDGGFLTYKALPTPVATPATDATNTSLSLTQPAGNVTVSVKYYQQAKFTHGGAPAAITGVQASTDNPIVTPGTPKTIGTSSVKMGTVKYYAAQSSSTAPTYDSEGWSEAVPTAATFSEGDVYVWYYIAGAEPASVAARSDANTCSDSDIKRLTVNLIAPPTYDVSLNKTGLADGEAAKWKAKSETVTTEVNLGTNYIEGVTKGETVTVTYTGSRKVIGVKAQKTDNKYLKWDAGQKKLVATKIPATATKVENANGNVTWPAGTYLVEGDVTIGGDILFSGDVELIIKDGAKLSAKHISGTDFYVSLSVYGQANMSGELNVACSDYFAICAITALNIHSCKVYASSSKSASGGIFNISEVNVYGGSVDAEYTGNYYGYGIFKTPLNIYGGEVKAVSMGIEKSKNYGIMGSDNGSSTVSVYGGKLWAECLLNIAISSNVTLTKEDGFNGKIETSADGTSWTEYSGTGTPDDPYVRVGY